MSSGCSHFINDIPYMNEKSKITTNRRPIYGLSLSTGAVYPDIIYSPLNIFSSNLYDKNSLSECFFLKKIHLDDNNDLVVTLIGVEDDVTSERYLDKNVKNPFSSKFNHLEYNFIDVRFKEKIYGKCYHDQFKFEGHRVSPLVFKDYKSYTTVLKHVDKRGSINDIVNSIIPHTMGIKISNDGSPINSYGHSVLNETIERLNTNQYNHSVGFGNQSNHSVGLGIDSYIQGIPAGIQKKNYDFVCGVDAATDDPDVNIFLIPQKIKKKINNKVILPVDNLIVEGKVVEKPIEWIDWGGGTTDICNDISGISSDGCTITIQDGTTMSSIGGSSWVMGAIEEPIIPYKQNGKSNDRIRLAEDKLVIL